MRDFTDPFRVAVKETATEANEAARRFAEAEGAVVEFASRAAAVERAKRLSAEGETPVAVQQAAPQDRSGVDAYLVSRPQRRRHDPDGSVATGLTFDTTANQYGALGEALICSPTVNPPVLTYFAREDPDVPDAPADADLRVELDTSPDPVVVGTDGKRWEPDCRAAVRLGPDRPLCKEYWCEVKTGDGSFERSQRAAMRAKAREATVLKIRVDVRDLPQSYTAWVRTLGAGGDDEVAVTAGGPNSKLTDF